MKTDVIESTIAAWTAEPEKGLMTPAVAAREDGGRALLEAGPFSWHADLPTSLGGANEAPSPTALLLGALAGCGIVFVRDVLSPQLGVAVESVTAKVSCQTDARGLVGIDDASPDLRDVSIEVTVTSPDGPEAVQRIEQVWKERCPIYLALVNPTPVKVTFAPA